MKTLHIYLTFFKGYDREVEKVGFNETPLVGDKLYLPVNRRVDAFVQAMIIHEIQDPRRG